MRISKKTRILMAFYEISKKQLAKDLNISPQSLSNYLNDLTNPPLDIIKKMAERLKISLDLLLNEQFELLVSYKETANQHNKNAEKSLIAEPRPAYFAELLRLIKGMSPEQIEALAKIIASIKEIKQ